MLPLLLESPLRLKKLEIIGFKSFADKTVLLFPPGVTAVVGPNGCGKSNIADALRWVLGEQSAKSMRGSKMPDVIFAGASSRKGVNIAEVTITFSDVAGSLPIDYDEVSVTRRLHRSGESEYFINRHPVRLKDVHSLFLDSGIGPNAFSIFEQGKMEEVIHLSPENRRAIFEDAAGIARFLVRKQETLRKLEQTEGHMVRVTDIQREVARQVIVLEEQAQKARKYKEGKSELEALEKAILIGKWELSNQLYNKLDVQSKEQKEKLKETTDHLLKLETSFHESKSQLNEDEKALITKSQELFSAKSSIEVKIQEQESNKERLHEVLSRQEFLDKEIEEANKRVAQIIKEIEENEIEEKKIDQELRQAENLLKNQRQHTNHLDTEVGLLRQRQHKAQQDRLKYIQEEGEAESSLKQSQIRLEYHEEKMTQFNKRRSEHARQVASHEQLTLEKQQQVKDLSNRIDQKRVELKQLESKQKDIVVEQQRTLKDLGLINQQNTELKARLKVLIKLKEEMQGLSQGAKKILQEARNSKSSLFGKILPLYEICTIGKEIEHAAAVAMKPYLHTLVVRTSDDLKEVLAFSKENKLKDFSLLCLEGLSVSPAEHFLQNISFSASTEEAFNRKLAEVWTDEGFFIDRFKVLFVPGQNESNPFSREAEIKSLEKEIEDKEKTKIRFEEVLKELDKKFAEIQTTTNTCDKTIRGEEMTLVEANFSLQRAISDLNKAKQIQKQAEEEEKQVAQEIEKLKKNIEITRERCETAKKKASEAKECAVNADAEMEQKLGVLKAHHKEQRAHEIAYQQLLEQHQKITYSLNLLNMRKQESQNQISKSKQELQTSTTLQNKIILSEAEGKKVLKNLEEILKERTEIYTTSEKAVEHSRQMLIKLENDLDILQQQVKTFEQKVYQVETQLNQCLNTRQTLESELTERYQITVFENLPESSLKDKKAIEAAEKETRTLRQALDSLGDVNMTAIEDYDQHKTRADFLAQQLHDLTVAKDELVKIIQGLDEESRKRLRETFDIVRSNFQKNFKILFQGGEADLQLTEADDLLKAGVEIVAKPPGKQMRSISLMSGGEKCLTSLALLFAIFEVKPAPFCILDEVDAPLDDSNIERFVTMLKQFLDSCQFITITHNKRTMAIADMLFGVSMEEKGVSKVLSLEFSHEGEPLPSII
jgi:chromosome segregation protein